jgi:hypothetical protein
MRTVRGLGSARWRIRPRRARCRGCGRTQVLLPVRALWRRADAVVVIGQALLVAAAGVGPRPIAVALGRPAGTVRGWLRGAASGTDPSATCGCGSLHRGSLRECPGVGALA